MCCRNLVGTMQFIGTIREKIQLGCWGRKCDIFADCNIVGFETSERGSKGTVLLLPTTSFDW